MKTRDQYDIGFSDGVILALQMMAAGGGAGSTDYVELLQTAGEGNVIARAKQEKMMRASGLAEYLRVKRRAEYLSGNGLTQKSAAPERRPLDCRVMPVTTKENDYA